MKRVYRPRLSLRRPTSFTGARVLVTGGASGFGLELARLLLADGARVVVGDRATERPASVPEGADYLRLDVTSDADWAASRAWVEEQWGGLDVLVNNAGVAVGGRIDATSIEDWDRALAVNLMGVVRGCRTFTPVFKAQHSGRIVNTASLAGLVHAPAMAAYNVTKAGVVALTETLSHELAPYGVAVTVICPSFFRTNLADSLAGADTQMEDAAVRLINGSPRSAEDVAHAAYLGLRAGRACVLVDVDGVVATWAKRMARPVYTAAMRRAGRRLATGHHEAEVGRAEA